MERERRPERGVALSRSARVRAWVSGEGGEAPSERGKRND